MQNVEGEVMKLLRAGRVGDALVRVNIAARKRKIDPKLVREVLNKTRKDDQGRIPQRRRYLVGLVREQELEDRLNRRFKPRRWSGNRSSIKSLPVRFDAVGTDGDASESEPLHELTPREELALLERRYRDWIVEGNRRRTLQPQSIANVPAYEPEIRVRPLGAFRGTEVAAVAK